VKSKPIQITEINGEMHTLCSDGSIWVYRESQFIALFEMEKKKKSTPKNSLQDEQKEFYETLKDYTETYDKSMLRAFYNYWSEPNQAGNKMRCRLERTWDVKRRLETWASRSTVNTTSTTVQQKTHVHDQDEQSERDRKLLEQVNKPKG